MPSGAPLIVEVKTLAGTLLASAHVAPMPIVWTCPTPTTDYPMPREMAKEQTVRDAFMSWLI